VADFGDLPSRVHVAAQPGVVADSDVVAGCANRSTVHRAALFDVACATDYWLDIAEFDRHLATAKATCS
jgi:hypothetical protein